MLHPKETQPSNMEKSEVHLSCGTAARQRGDLYNHLMYGIFDLDFSLIRGFRYLLESLVV